MYHTKSWKLFPEYSSSNFSTHPQILWNNQYPKAPYVRVKHRPYRGRTRKINSNYHHYILHFWWNTKIDFPHKPSLTDFPRNSSRAREQNPRPQKTIEVPLLKPLASSSRKRTSGQDCSTHGISLIVPVLIAFESRWRNEAYREIRAISLEALSLLTAMRSLGDEATRRSRKRWMTWHQSIQTVWHQRGDVAPVRRVP